MVKRRRDKARERTKQKRSAVKLPPKAFDELPYSVPVSDHNSDESFALASTKGQQPTATQRKLHNIENMCKTRLLNPTEDGLYRCAYCLDDEEVRHHFKRCSHCELVKYCSKKCQKEDWPQHKKRSIKDIEILMVEEEEELGCFPREQEQKELDLQKFERNQIRNETTRKLGGDSFFPEGPQDLIEGRTPDHQIPFGSKAYRRRSKGYRTGKKPDLVSRFSPALGRGSIFNTEPDSCDSSDICERCEGPRQSTGISVVVFAVVYIGLVFLAIWNYFYAEEYSSVNFVTVMAGLTTSIDLDPNHHDVFPSLGRAGGIVVFLVVVQRILMCFVDVFWSSDLSFPQKAIIALLSFFAGHGRGTGICYYAGFAAWACVLTLLFMFFGH